ncbi:LytTR family DNA-binding domain-containing protein [Fulvivirga maritima]|uniref:LytR/AlgR family response regulator transcription factor n=1 Tax=Fulvivirga maritima TaxID=2904247 RepID=UPI001F41D128|nr:LytTR family DNA-binding domain-containing protein [Fulvivirga maritima]UII28334.1 LytTR family DNA-binding domain-containing protein [Fulvivirga maritima]
MSEVMKCLVVDDEAIAARGMVNYINRTDYLKLARSCDSAQAAYDTLQQENIDLMFLDINMPEQTGIELLQSLPNAPLTIFTTAYAEYALEAFNLHVVDYLMKPIAYNRFTIACEKARSLFQSQNNALAPQSIDNNLRYIRQGDSFIKIHWSEILYVEAMQNYLKLHFKDQVFTIHQTMNSIEESLPVSHFFRVHRSYLINVTAIESITGNMLTIKGSMIPISRQRKDDLIQNIVLKKLLSK